MPVSPHYATFSLDGPHSRRTFPPAANMITVAFLPYSPPSILECLLARFKGQEISLTTRSHHRACDQRRRGWFESAEEPEWFFSTDPRQLIRLVYNSIFLQGEAVGIIEKKIGLLIEYEAINRTETQAFEKMLRVVKETYGIGKRVRGLDADQHGMLCWYKLNMSISGLIQPEYIEQEVDMSITCGERLHSFMSRSMSLVPGILEDFRQPGWKVHNEEGRIFLEDYDEFDDEFDSREHTVDWLSWSATTWNIPDWDYCNLYLFMERTKNMLAWEEDEENGTSILNA